MTTIKACKSDINTQENNTNLGVGIGLRIPHLKHVIDNQPKIPWFEVHSCNFLKNSLNKQLLYKVAENYPISLHGVSLNLGGVTPIDTQYVTALRQLVADINPVLISEHACFTAHLVEQQTQFFHDLLPIPYTMEAVNHFCQRINQVQELLNRPILIENISRYYQYSESEMSEGNFLAEVAKRTGCGILLDINNAYVNQVNLNIDAKTLFKELKNTWVGEVHLAGFSVLEKQLLDTHSAPVSDPVWHLYEAWCQARGHFDKVPCLIEWDSELPSFHVLEQEKSKAENIQAVVNNAAVLKGFNSEF